MGHASFHGRRRNGFFHRQDDGCRTELPALLVVFHVVPRIRPHDVELLPREASPEGIDFLEAQSLRISPEKDDRDLFHDVLFAPFLFARVG